MKYLPLAIALACVILSGCRSLTPEAAKFRLEGAGIAITDDNFWKKVDENDLDTAELMLFAGLKPKGHVKKHKAESILWKYGAGGNCGCCCGDQVEPHGEEMSWSPLDLRIAAYRCNYKYVEYLLDNGADPNAREDDDGLTDSGELTALLLAAMKRHADVVELLLEYGADPDIASDKWGSPMWYSCESFMTPSSRMAIILLEHGADPNYCFPREKNKVIDDDDNVVYSEDRSVLAQTSISRTVSAIIASS